MVQAEFIRRQQLGKVKFEKAYFHLNYFALTSGGFYGQKVWHSNSKYRKVIWQFNNKFKDKKNRCCIPTLEVTQIKDSFLKAYNKLITKSGYNN